MTQRSLLVRLLIGILLAAVLTACGGQPAATQEAVDVDLTVQAGAQTMVAAVFETQTAIAPPPTDTPLPTPTSLPTLASTPLSLPTTTAAIATQPILIAASPTPTGTFYTSTPLSSSLAVGCSNMSLIRDVTIPSGTQMKPGEKFTKTWQIANTGTCEWLYGTTLVHASGERMSGNGGRLNQKGANLPVPVGEWRQVSVELEAPQTPGTYTAGWRIANGDGKVFGATLGVSIVVKKNPDPTATPNVLQTAAAGTVAVQLTQTAAAQQTAISIGQTAMAAATATPTSTTVPPTATPTPTCVPGTTGCP